MAEITALSQLNLDQQYSYADYLSWKFEQAVELIKGKILPISASSRRHQQISRDVSGGLFVYFKSNPCEFYVAPFDVRLLDRGKSSAAEKDVYSVVQPDLCVVCDTSKLDDKGCLGAPDLIVEILSPGNSAREMRLKKNLYEENQVREYWIFDPERETVLRFGLTESGTFDRPEIFINEDTLSSLIFPDLHIELQEIFKQR